MARSPLAVYQQQQRKQMSDKYRNDQKVMLDYRNGEEGVDFVNPPEDKQSFWYQQQEQVWKDTEDVIRKKNPKAYREMERNGIFQDLHPKELIKDHTKVPLYPGTEKGPDPQDDPEFYNQWLWENLPAPMKKVL